MTVNVNENNKKKRGELQVHSILKITAIKDFLFK
jgi:hypothetical protein